MTRETAISIARESLDKNGFQIRPEPTVVRLVAADEFNKNLTAKQVAGPHWVVMFALKAPNDVRSHAIISVDDTTGVASEGQAS